MTGRRSAMVDSLAPSLGGRTQAVISCSAVLVCMIAPLSVPWCASNAHTRHVQHTSRCSLRAVTIAACESESDVCLVAVIASSGPRKGSDRPGSDHQRLLAQCIPPYIEHVQLQSSQDTRPRRHKVTQKYMPRSTTTRRVDVPPRRR